MYVTQNLACSVPNSATPVTQDQITAGVSKLATMEGKIAVAQAALNQAIHRTDMGPVPAASQSWNPLVRLPYRNWPAIRTTKKNGQAVVRVCKAELTSSPVTSLPAVPPMPPLTTRPLGIPTTPPVKLDKIPTTGNVCKDLRLGWVLPEQVDAQQLFECAMKGYAGVLAPPAAILKFQEALKASGGLPTVPFQTVDPAAGWQGIQEENDAHQQYGMGATGFSIPWAGIGFGLAGLYLLFDYVKGGHKRVR